MGFAVLNSFSYGMSVILISNYVIAVCSETAGCGFFAFWTVLKIILQVLQRFASLFQSLLKKEGKMHRMIIRVILIDHFRQFFFYFPSRFTKWCATSTLNRLIAKQSEVQGKITTSEESFLFWRMGKFFFLKKKTNKKNKQTNKQNAYGSKQVFLRPCSRAQEFSLA